MKYRELLNNITEVARKHPNINSTFIGDVYELNHRNDVDYCAFVITQGTHRVNSDEDYIDYTLNLFYVDRLTADESNRTQIHSSGIDFMNSLLRAVEKLGVVVVEHTENVFNERFNDVCAGVYATVVFRCEIDECGQTIEIITPDELKVLKVTDNGIYKGLFKEVDVNVQGGGKEPVLETLNVKDNGTYRPKTGVDGFDIVEVNIPKEHHNVTSKSITENGVYNSDGNEVWNEVSVNVPERQPVLESLSVTENGIYNAPSNIDGYNTVNVNVSQSGGTGFDTTQLSQLQIRQNLDTVDLTGLDTRNVRSMNNMFYYCAAKTLDLSHLNTSEVESFDGMFSYSSLTTIDVSNFDTLRAYSFTKMFYYCTKLTSLNISNFDMSRGRYVTSIFEVCRSLTTIISDGFKLPDADLSVIGLDWCPLTVDSIVGLLNALPQSTNGYSFQIGEDNIAKLSDDQKAIATNKNWRLV